MRESRVHASDLILPVFVLDGHDVVQDVASMPGVQRMTLDRLYPVAEECVRLKIPVLALALTAINMFGGFAVTRRMLAMFRK